MAMPIASYIPLSIIRPAFLLSGRELISLLDKVLAVVGEHGGEHALDDVPIANLLPWHLTPQCEGAGWLL